MIRFDILTLFPNMFKGLIEDSIIKRAIEKKLIEVNLIDFREFSTNKHHTVDDYSYGGGAGMLISVEPVHLAMKTIPNLEKAKNKIVKTYGVKHKKLEERKTSRSGGVFVAISDYILERGGVVYGVKQNDDFSVCHARATTKEERDAFKGSKYVQSDMKDTVQSIAKDLDKNKKVLFSGTPCQVHSIKNYLSNNNLFFVDIVCHGVPSPIVFEDYKKHLENKYNSKIININFRYKDENAIQNMKIDFENGKSYISNFLQKDIFYNLFLKDIILRDSCYSCEYKNFNRRRRIANEIL